MKCHSVQALWASTPPAHQVMVMVALNNPPSLWTGGSRGDIIYWKLPPPPPPPPLAHNHLPQDIWPVALLCGHTTEVAGIVACKVDEERENTAYKNDANMLEKDVNLHDVVVSLCVEGWICSWDSLTGRCRRRRRLPPWVGTPCIMKAVPRSQGSLVIACDGNIPGLSKNAPSGNDEPNKVKKISNHDKTISLERSSSMKDMRGTVIIVDSSSLAILQVVFHGLLGIGPVKALALFPVSDLSHRLTISDHTGQIRAWNITLNQQEKIGNGAECLWKEYSPDESDFWSNSKAISLSDDGLYGLVVFKTHWLIISTKNQTIIQESSQIKSDSSGVDWFGGIFLVETSAPVMPENGVYTFLVWDSCGGAVLYCMKNPHSELDVKEVSRLPMFSLNPDLQYTVKYYQLSELLICVVSSNSSEIPDTLIRAWILPFGFMCSFKEAEKLPLKDCFLGNGHFAKNEECTLYGEGSLRSHWSDLSFSDLQGNRGLDMESTSEHRLLADSCSSCPSAIEWVTASMVLFDKSSTPTQFVLGFNSGNIKLILLRTTLADREENGCFVQDLHKHVRPVTCLAELSLSNEASVLNTGKRFLVSGGMDCLTCIWDLSHAASPLMTLHHHVTPVHQIVLPPLGTYAPWSNCFITVGEDGCIALVSLETLQVERMFVGHPSRPRMITWDGLRGYLCCLCATSGDVLFMWDIKSGALERVLRGTAAHSMYDNFMKQVRGTSITNVLFDMQANSIASLLHGDTGSPSQLSGSSHMASSESSFNQVSADGKQPTSSDIFSNKMAGSFEKLSMKLSQALNQSTKTTESHMKRNGSSSNSTDVSNRNLFHKHPPIKGVSPFPGVVALQFDLFTLMAPDLGRLGRIEREELQTKLQTSITHIPLKEDFKAPNEARSLDRENGEGAHVDLASNLVDLELLSTLGSIEGRILRASLAFLHLWGADLELDKCLQKELRIIPPTSIGSAAGFAGDRGASTLFLPGWKPTFEIWKSSAEFCALRSLTIVATALRMTTLSRLTCTANSALAAFYTRELAEKFPDVKAPSLELYSCFWQDPSEYVRMAARSLFHCAASRAIPLVLSARSTAIEKKNSEETQLFESTPTLLMVEQALANEQTHEKARWPNSVCASSEIINWLESSEGQAWTAVVGGTSQDARAGRIIVGAALAVWYPCLVRPELAPSVAPYLVKLVKAIVDRHSAVAAELLADGMETVWQHLIAEEIPSLISDIFLLIECLSGGGTAKPTLVSNPATAVTIKETLTGNLLPSLATADIVSFLGIVQSQISSASSDSPLQLTALMTIIRIIRSAPRAVVSHLSQVVGIILHIMNTGKHCHETAMAAVKEMVRVYPMVALHQVSGKLGVGDVAGDVHSLAIHVYDINSSSKVRILDASGPPGHPALHMGDDTANTGGISALEFSEDGEGVVAFSQHGLMIRWWSLNSVWWEKLSRITTPIQCNKLVLVPPWSGFSPKSSRSSIMATISDLSNCSKESPRQLHDDRQGKPLSQSIDLTFRLEWRKGKKLALLHQVHELGEFQF